MAQLILPIPSADQRAGAGDLPADANEAYAALTALVSESNAQDGRLTTLEGNDANKPLVSTALTLPSGFTATAGFGTPGSVLIRPGLVHVHGYIDAGAANTTPAAGTTIATLTGAHHPSVQRQRFGITTDQASSTSIPYLVGTDGTIKTQYIVGKRYFILDMLVEL